MNMRTVALISGGKDSCYNMMQCVTEGHEIVALANLRPEHKDELDSYMYQTVGHHAIDLYAEAMDLPLYRRTIKGSSKETGRDYLPTEDDEVEDLYELLKDIKEEMGVDAVSVGAILSDYQRVRVENVCQRLGLTSLAYLWRRDQKELLEEMIQCGLVAVIIKVASLGLEPDKHLGKTLQEMQPHLLKMNAKYQLNVCGEGGEYETFTLDCPLFKKKIILDEVETVIHSSDAFAPVGYLNLKKSHMEDKPQTNDTEMGEKLKHLPMKRSSNILHELFSEEEVKSMSQNSQKTIISVKEKDNLTVDDSTVQMRVRGDNLWISGLIAVKTEIMTLQDITRETMDKLKGIVESISDNWNMGCLTLVHLYVQNMADFVEVNSVYKTYFGINPPARVCVQAALPPNVVLQIDCHGNCAEASRKTMHVQGLSHWAPANIGPYSQCTKISEKVNVAGQIALCPATMKIISGGIIPEARLSLRHVERVLEAMHYGCNLSQIATAVCYVTSPSYITIAQAEWNRALKKCQGEDSEEGDNEQDGVVCYVVIPQLPRNALIEWQVIAMATEHVTKEIEESASVGSCRGIIRCHYSDKEDEEEEDSYVHCFGYVELLSNEKQNSSSADIAQCFCRCFSHVLQKLEGRSHFPLLRIFFSPSQLNFNELYKELRSGFSAFEDEIFSLVPVSQLSQPSTLLTACC